MENNSPPEAEEPQELPEVEETMNTMADLLAEHDMTIDLPQRGEIREGTIVSISKDLILVDVGAKSEGSVSGRELEAVDDEVLKALVVGDLILVYIVNPDDNSQVILSIAKAQEEQNWIDAEELMNSQKVLEGKISGHNKGGLIMRVGQLRGFIPASQISTMRHSEIDESQPAEKRYANLRGKDTVVKVIEVDRRRNRLILSEKATDREFRDRHRDTIFTELAPGEVRKGRVRSLTNFGAFVDLGGADGLVHLSEMSWKRIKHPSEVVQEGETVEVEVLSVDRDRRRIALSMKRTQGDPWDQILRDVQDGQLVEGEITKLENFGAFAAIEGYDSVEGLIHISELSEQRITHPKSVVKVGEKLTLRVLRIESDKRRLALSLKEVASPQYMEQDLAYYRNLGAQEADAAPAAAAVEAPAKEGETAIEEAEVEAPALVTEIDEVVAEAEVEAEVVAEAEVEPEAEPEVEPEAELEAEPEVEAEPVVEAEAELEAEPEVEAEPVVEAEPEVEAEAEVEAEPEVEEEEEKPDKASA